MLSGQGGRNDGGNKRKGLCPQITQMDADEAGFSRIGVNLRELHNGRERTQSGKAGGGRGMLGRGMRATD